MGALFIAKYYGKSITQSQEAVALDCTLLLPSSGTTAEEPAAASCNS